MKKPIFQRLWGCLSGAPERQAHERLLQASQLALVNMALLNFNKAVVAQARNGGGLRNSQKWCCKMSKGRMSEYQRVDASAAMVATK